MDSVQGWNCAYTTNKLQYIYKPCHLELEATPRMVPGAKEKCSRRSFPAKYFPWNLIRIQAEVITVMNRIKNIEPEEYLIGTYGSCQIFDVMILTLIL